MTNFFNDFTNQFSKSITLKNELIPVGKTLENIKKYNILSKDELRNDNYELVKVIIDKFHRYYIEAVLSNVDLDWNDLYKSICQQKKLKNPSNKKNVDEKEKQRALKDYESLLSLKRKQLFKYFSEISLALPNGVVLPIKFEDLFSKKLFTSFLDNFVSDKVVIEKIEKFKNFTTYFTGFNENRRNIYSVEKQTTSLFYRLVDDNFLKFVANISIYEKWKSICPFVLTETEKYLKENNVLDENTTLDAIFSVDHYNNVLRQKDIDQYNNLISGFSADVGEVKIQGLNEHVNLAIQKDEKLRDLLKKDHSLKMTLLFKQILSEKESNFKINEFKSDEELINSVKELYDVLLAEEGNFNKLKKILSNLPYYDLSLVFVQGKAISKLSTTLFGGIQWNKISEAIDNVLKNDKQYLKNKKNSDGEIENTIAKSEFSISFLSKCLNLADTQNNIEYDLAKLISEKVISTYKDFFETKEIKWPKNLKTDADKKIIKNILDGLINFSNLCSILTTDAIDKDQNFYCDYDIYINEFKKIKLLYNKARNYCTKKPYSYDKFKLNFECVQLAKGWSDSKLDECLSTIFIKNGQYFLGIINRESKPDFKNNLSVDNDKSFKRVRYLLFKDLSKMLPKCTTQMKDVVNQFNNEGKSEVILSDPKKFSNPLKITREIFELNNPNNGEIKKFSSEYAKTGDKKVYKESLTKWINFAKEFLFSYQGTKDFDYSSLKETSEYESLVQFYSDVDAKSYKIDYENINEDYINSCIDEGKLFLFKIHNKDFSPKSTGSKNLHTLYFLNIFSSENANVGTIKLNGEAELFYRKASIESDNIVVHKKGTKVVNRTYLNEEKSCIETLSDDAHSAIYKHENNISQFLPKQFDVLKSAVKVKELNHDIVKDKRFTTDKFFFHCPITLNFKSPREPIRFNQKVLNYLRNNKDVNIIGIDRGERNLIYISVIDQSGNIITQRSLNTVTEINNTSSYSKEVDYAQKLSNKQNNRQEARKNWTTIGQIKNIKEGYLSAVVHEVVKLVIKYNAIVVMENLNSGFKRIRQGISEKSVYQKFESMLIEKLNYLTFKSNPVDKIGGILKGYQLTDKFDTFTRLGLQSGIVFYVNPSYTSKIDPTTGFANTLVLNNYSDANSRREFFKKFSEISYDSNLDMFKFCIDFSQEGLRNTVNMRNTEWEIYSVGERIVRLPKSKDSGPKEILQNLTSEYKKLFAQYSIDFESGNNIINSITSIDASKSNANFWKSMFFLFKNTLQMRNSSNQFNINEINCNDRNINQNSNLKNKVIDYLISPVMNKEGKFFNSDFADDKLPLDADANGAYHIALKGLMILKRNDEFDENDKSSKISLVISNDDWFKFAQGRFE